MAASSSGAVIFFGTTSVVGDRYQHIVLRPTHLGIPWRKSQGPHSPTACATWEYTTPLPASLMQAALRDERPSIKSSVARAIRNSASWCAGATSSSSLIMRFTRASGSVSKDALSLPDGGDVGVVAALEGGVFRLPLAAGVAASCTVCAMQIE